MANFEELIPKVSNWDVEEEEMLINKIKSMTEDYQQKCSNLSLNLNNINRNLHLMEVDFFNALNGLKTLSGTKFIEHIVDTEDKKPEEEEQKEENPAIEENIKDEHINNINSILQRSFDFIALKDQQRAQNRNNNNNNNNPDDDTMSMNSKIMDNNLTKNNRGLKLPLIIGSNDFNQNEYVGLVNDEDEEEEENFNNEIKNDVEIPPPPEENPNLIQGEANLANNPEYFHNMIQQNMGKPIRSQSMFDEENNEKDLGNALAMQVDEQEDTGLGGLLRSSSIRNPKPNNIIGQENLGLNGNNINRNTLNNLNMPNMRMSAIGGKGPSITNFLGNNFFEDDDDDDGSGLFSRPKGMNRGGLGMSMLLPGNNLLNNNFNLNNNINNNPLMNSQNIMMQQNGNQFNPMLNLQAQNNNNILENQNNQQMQQPQVVPQENEKLPLNQRMEMVPNPLLLAMQQQNIPVENDRHQPWASAHDG